MRTDMRDRDPLIMNEFIDANREFLGAMMPIMQEVTACPRNDFMSIWANAEIDGQIFDSYARTQLTLQAGGSGTFVANEIAYQGASLATATAKATVHNYVAGSQVNVIRVVGAFANNTILKGNTSNASWTVNTTSDTFNMNNAFEDVIDNYRIETEGAAILDFTEHNPFGEPS